MSGFTCTWASPAWPKMTPSMPWRVSAARTPRTYSGRRSGGTAPSSMNCMEARAGCSRERIGLAPWRSSHSVCSMRGSRATVTCVAPDSRKARSSMRAPSCASAGCSPSISASSTASASGGDGKWRAAASRDVEKGAVEQLAGGGAESARGGGRLHAGLEGREGSEHRAGGARPRRQRELQADEEGQRALAADEQVHQVAAAGVAAHRVPGRVLAHAGQGEVQSVLTARVGRRGSAQLHVERRGTRQRRHVGRRRGAAAHHRPRAIREDAVERPHPGAHGAVPQRVRAGRVGGRHAAHGAEGAAGRVHGESQAVPRRRRVHRSAR